MLFQRLSFIFCVGFSWLFAADNAENQPLIREVRYLKISPNSRCNSDGYLLYETAYVSALNCAFSCLSAANCTSFNAPNDNADGDADGKRCELLGANYYECNSNDHMIDSLTHNFYDLDFCHPNPCPSNKVCRSNHIGGITTVYCVG